MKIVKKNFISVQDWDDLVEKTYGKPYSFQQQDDCKPRGIFQLTVPGYAEDYEKGTVPEIVNHPEMGVSFSAWLARDPKQRLSSSTQDWHTELWWHRNFYPEIQMVANDLNSKGLLPAGEYVINIDW